jgi:hypothetical protein
MSIENVYRLIQSKQINFEGSHNVFMPQVLVDDILSQIDLNNKRILVLFNIEFAISLRIKYNCDNVVFYSDHETKTEFAKQLGCDVITKTGDGLLEELDSTMKFDVVVGNPPFSKVNQGKIAGKWVAPLYKKFFKKSLELAKIVAMVLPRTDMKIDTSHNDLLKSHATLIKNIDESTFKNIAMPMWYMIVDDRPQDISNINWAISNTPNNNIKWERGKLNMSRHWKKNGESFGTSEKMSPDDVTIYHKISASTGLLVLYSPASVVDEKRLFPSSGYAVLMPQSFTPHGWSKTAIVKCDGKQAAFNGMGVVFTETLKEAEELVERMKTPEFIAEGNRLKQGKGSLPHTCLAAIKF